MNSVVGSKILSIIIPAYNEENTIAQTLKKVLEVDLKELSVEKEIIVVDDGSKDNTYGIIKDIPGIKVVKKENNGGKGTAIVEGLRNVTGEIVLIQDADLEYDPGDYPALITPILDGKADIVYGSRFMSKKRPENMKLKFYLGNRVLAGLTNLLYGSAITDEATCYKVFRTKLLKQLKLECRQFEFCPEVTAKLLKKGYKIHEVPVTYFGRSVEEGKKIGWKDGVQAVQTLLKYRFKD